MKYRPNKLEGMTYRVPSPVGTAFITITEDKEGPMEVFVNVGKGGSNTASLAEMGGRLISLIFRMEDGLTNKEKAIEIVGQLKDIGSTGVAGVGENQTYSLPDAIAQAMARYVGVWEDEDRRPDPEFT